MATPKAGFNTNPQNINTKGRPPKGYSITETVKAMLNEKPEIKQALAAKVMELAMKGDVTAMKMLWNYMDGMPLQKTKLSGDEDNPLVVDGSFNVQLTKVYGQTSASKNDPDSV